MANVQFCPVCGYALKKLDTQCGRCGESVGEDAGQSQLRKQTRPAARYTGGYSIEAIGLGGGVDIADAGAPVPQSYGIREINHKQASADEKEGSMENLQRELKDLNDRIARMDEEKRADMTLKAEAGTVQPPEPPQNFSYKSDVVRHFRRKNDREFKSIVSQHVATIRQMAKSAEEAKVSTDSPHHRFIDEKLVKPGVFDRSVILFVGPAGSMKSTMAANTVSQMARAAKGRALYLILDESKEKFEKRIRELGIQKDDGVIQVADSAEIREVTANIEGNWRMVILEYIKQEFRRKPFQFIVMDNLNALQSMVSTDKDRKVTFAFFDWMREFGLTAIAIKEGEYKLAIHGRGAEAYLADGVVQFHRRKRGDGGLVPMFRVMKMRGAEIDSRYQALQVSSGSLRFVPVVAI